jgi:hypothetical protein
MPDTTLLAIAEIDVPPYSARGISQTLQPIGGAGQMRRTVNGTLVDISATQFRKYRSTIACTDQQQPALDGVWPGMTLTIDCVSELSYKTGVGTAGRTAVSGSSRTESGFTFYRPVLTMKVVDYSVDTDEWGASIGWQLQLEEI